MMLLSIIQRTPQHFSSGLARNTTLGAVCVLLSACHANVDLRKVTISNGQNAANSEGTLFSYTVIADIPRTDVIRLTRDEVHTYIHLVDCKSREVIYALLPKLHGTDITEFSKMRTVTDHDLSPLYNLSATLSERSDITGKAMCATLDGGGYNLVKVSASTIRVEWRSS